MQHKPFAQSTMGKRFLETDAPCLKTKVLFLTKKQKNKNKKKLGTTGIFKNWIIFQMPWGGSNHREPCHECFYKWRIILGIEKAPLIYLLHWFGGFCLVIICLPFVVFFEKLEKKTLFVFLEYLLLKYSLLPSSITFSRLGDSFSSPSTLTPWE